MAHGENVFAESSAERLIPEENIDRLEQEFIDKYYVRNNRNPLRTLARLYRRYYKKLLASVIFCVIKTSPGLFLPIATANIIDVIAARPEHPWRVVLINALIALGLLTINIPFHVLYIKYLSVSTRSVEAGLRGAIVRKLQQLSIRFNKEMLSGRIQTKIIRDVEAIHELSFQTLNTILDTAINLVTILVVILVKQDWYILAFFALCGPASAMFSRFFIGNIRFSNRMFRVEMENTSVRVSDMVEMIPVTRAHGLGDEETRRMTEQVSHLAARGLRLDRVSSLFGSVNWVVMQAFRLACLIFTVALALNEVISAGDVTLYQSYFTSLVAYISTIVNMIPILARGGESINSVGEILGANDVEDNRGKKKLDEVRGAFAFEDVRFSYEDGRPVLNGLDLAVRAGETVAIVGESGAGKSTILNLATGFYMPSSGRVTVDGIDLSQVDLTSYRRHIAVVPQTSALFSGTIRDNITYGAPDVSEARLAEVLDAACLRSVVDALPEGLDTPVGEHGGHLSGGQRQRISIARALIRDPRVIILDEATNALDTVSEKHIQTAIHNLSRGRTTLIVAHRLSTVKDADRIAVLKDGKCVEFGTFDELMALNGEFSRFRNLQV
ncbi:MAG: ABC transporter ATP-binding protein [Oscillospiraceae bacterium]|nr:ABC transporter ATP-binding protein [Oscillospiraceae bacterium]